MQKISKSVFVTNFLEDSTARDLWKVCSDYGTVVDVFIPFKRSKSDLKSHKKPDSSIPRGPNHSTPKETNMENSKKSVVSVLKRGSQSHVTPEITKPALVLDETCIKEFDFGMSLMGRAKDVSAIPNLPYAWFLNFQKDDQDDLSSDGESQEGDVTNKANNNKSHVDRVSKSSFTHENDTAHKDVNKCKKKSDEPKFPPGFNPDNNDKKVEENIKDTTQRVQSLSNKLNDRCSNRGFSSQQSMNSHSQKSKVGGSILDLMDELVTVGQPIGLGNKAKQRWIKELCQKHRINFVSIQETKSESISLHTIKDFWKNQIFDHLVGSSVGSSGGRKETNYDYGPSFWFFHSWFAMEGFNSFVETTWKSLNIIEPNGLIWLKKKLQALKIAIKAWSKEANKRLNDRKINIQQNLSEVNKLIDQGKSNDEILIKRITLLNDLHELNNRNAMEISQKAKIRWSIEGGENSKYFHDIMNKKRSQLVIRGTLANREWISEPHRVKNEFLLISRSNFRLSKLLVSALTSLFQLAYLHIKFKIWSVLLLMKRSKWLFGIVAPTNHSFEFYRKYWTIDDDVFQAIRDFLVNGNFPRGFFFAHNRALLFKWVWRFLTDGSSLWTRFIKSIFGNKGALDTHKLVPRRSPWQDVILAIHSLQSKGINLMDFIQKKVGNGDNTSFWDDSWLGEVALKVLYKRMPRGGVEQKNYDLLCSKVTDLVLPNISDRWCWSLEGSQEF
nr:RNA-directed DNA polymerase, eukaryota [Tanacetum cinerariifolium]